MMRAIARARCRWRVYRARRWARKHVPVITAPWLKDDLWHRTTEPKEK